MKYTYVRVGTVVRRRWHQREEFTTNLGVILGEAGEGSGSKRKLIVSFGGRPRTIRQDYLLFVRLPAIKPVTAEREVFIRRDVTGRSGRPPRKRREPVSFHKLRGYTAYSVHYSWLEPMTWIGNDLEQLAVDMKLRGAYPCSFTREQLETAACSSL